MGDTEYGNGLEDFLKFIPEFMNESDRAAVVLGGAKLDLLLHQILEGFFLSVKDEDSLLGQGRPLRSFGAKIDVIYRLGLLNAEVTKLLHSFRKIRNEFAHEVDNCDLNSQRNQSRLKEMMVSFADSETFNAVKAQVPSQFKLSPASLDFRIMLALLITQLSALKIFVPKVSGGKALPLLIPK
jgi:DNA-binding MltR family transcriptional regulator